MSLDFEHQHRATLPDHGLNANGIPIDLSESSQKAIRNRVLLDLAHKLFKYNKSISSYVELPQPDSYSEEDAHRDSLYEREVGQYNSATLAEEVREYERLDGPISLNVDQRRIYNAFVDALDLDYAFDNDNDMQSNNMFFVDGPGGCGKTHLYKSLLAYTRSKGAIALATASSGIAATLLPGGSTAHSKFKIPLNLTEETVCNLKIQTSTASLLKDARLIIWDEAHMMHRFAFEAVDRLFKELHGNNLPFGGTVVVLGGDFRQILPVIKGNSRADVVDASILRSYLFRHIQHMRLTRNMRVLDSQSTVDGVPFPEYLLKIGEGRVGLGLNSGNSSDEAKRIQVPTTLLKNIKSINEVVDIVFGSILSDENQYEDPNIMIGQAILAPTNALVDLINEVATNKMPGTSTVLLSEDEADEELNIVAAAGGHPVEYLHTLKPSGMPPHKLVLKRYQPIICLRNISPEEGLCNGTRLIVCNISRHIIEAEIAVGDFAGTYVLITRVTLHTDDNGVLPFTLKRKQFPVQPAFGMTINKSQGQTLFSVAVCLLSPVFTHRQLYVALSRVRDHRNLKLLLPDGSDTEKDKTDNVVYTEVLQ